MSKIAIKVFINYTSDDSKDTKTKYRIEYSPTDKENIEAFCKTLPPEDDSPLLTSDQLYLSSSAFLSAKIYQAMKAKFDLKFASEINTEAQLEKSISANLALSHKKDLESFPKYALDQNTDSANKLFQSFEECQSDHLPVIDDVQGILTWNISGYGAMSGLFRQEKRTVEKEMARAMIQANYLYNTLKSKPKIDIVCLQEVTNDENYVFCRDAFLDEFNRLCSNDNDAPRMKGFYIDQNSFNERFAITPPNKFGVVTIANKNVYEYSMPLQKIPSGALERFGVATQADRVFSQQLIRKDNTPTREIWNAHLEFTVFGMPKYVDALIRLAADAGCILVGDMNGQLDAKIEILEYMFPSLKSIEGHPHLVMGNQTLSPAVDLISYNSAISSPKKVTDCKRTHVINSASRVDCTVISVKEESRSGLSSKIKIKIKFENDNDFNDAVVALFDRSVFKGPNSYNNASEYYTPEIMKFLRKDGKIPLQTDEDKCCLVLSESDLEQTTLFLSYKNPENKVDLKKCPKLENLVKVPFDDGIVGFSHHDDNINDKSDESNSSNDQVTSSFANDSQDTHLQSQQNQVFYFKTADRRFTKSDLLTHVGGNEKLRKTIFIFPGNPEHHSENTTLLSQKTGGGLAKLAEDLGADGYPCLSLPTTGIDKVDNEDAIPLIAKNAVADLWRAVGAGYNLMLITRNYQSFDTVENKYFSSPISGTNFEPSFYGQNEKTANIHLADYYVGQINAIKTYLEKDKKPRHISPQFEANFAIGVKLANENANDLLPNFPVTVYQQPQPKNSAASSSATAESNTNVPTNTDLSKMLNTYKTHLEKHKSEWFYSKELINAKVTAVDATVNAIRDKKSNEEIINILKSSRISEHSFWGRWVRSEGSKLIDTIENKLKPNK